MTKSEFLTKTAPIQVTVGGVSQVLPPRKFGADKPEAERSVGFNYNGKVPIPAGAGVIELNIAGFPLGAGKKALKAGAKEGFFGQSKVTIGGQAYQVGANIVDLGTGQGQATVNITAVKSKAWEPGDPASPASEPKPATAALAAPVVPAGPRSMTRQEATDAFAQALGIPREKLMEQAGLTKSLNKWAKASSVVIV